MLRSAVSAFTRVVDRLWLAAWCAADPGPVTVKLWVPAVRNSTSAAPRPGHDAVACRGARPSGNANVGDWGNRSAGRYWRGTGNEGVGEHVRTRFHLRLGNP